MLPSAKPVMTQLGLVGPDQSGVPGSIVGAIPVVGDRKIFVLDGDPCFVLIVIDAVLVWLQARRQNDVVGIGRHVWFP